MTKKEMINYISSFELYPTINRSNQIYGYSINCKIYLLPLTDTQKEILFQIIIDEDLSDDYYSHLDEIKKEYEDKINEFWKEAIRDPLQNVIDLYPDKRHKSKCNVCGVHSHHNPGFKCSADLYITGGCRGNLEAIEYSEDYLNWLKYRQFIIVFNGKSGGHLVLCKWNGYNYLNSSWNFDEVELNRMLKEEVERIYKVLCIFEDCFDGLLKASRDFINKKS